MPLYDYSCNSCQTVFEVRASFKEKEEGFQPECPQCKSQDTRQVITAGLLLLGKSDGASFQASGCGPGAGLGCCG